ncbi:aspartate aminotransferase family protein [Kocuria sp. NPDC057446]|uniref:aspartate aminotransferase family protein n=1 Tax=Kocuria sp. NPDC057446 TaxID=3346137 RepID=UPI00367A1DEF
MSFVDDIVAESTNLRERAVKVMPGGITRSTLFLAPHPPYAVRGEGAVITDNTGHQVIDCNNNYTSLIHGHAHPAITSAAVKVISEGTAFGLPTDREVVFAELLAERVGLPHWRFCNSGTEAVMMAIRAARAYTGRDLLIRFSDSYHGTSDAVVAPDAAGVPTGTTRDVLVLPQADSAAFKETMASQGSRVAAVLIDLMPNRAGLVPVPQDFAGLVREQTDRHGALMIVDEVITLRLGTDGLAGRYGIRPDLVTAAKIIGGGFPVGAVGGRAEVLEPFNPLGNGSVSWGGTFSANPVTLAAGLEAMRSFNRTQVEALNTAGDELRATLHAAHIPVSGLGSLLRLRHPDLERLWWSLYERNVMVGTNGLIALSTAMNDTHLDNIREAVLAAYQELS